MPRFCSLSLPLSLSFSSQLLTQCFHDRCGTNKTRGSPRRGRQNREKERKKESELRAVFTKHQVLYERNGIEGLRNEACTERNTIKTRVQVDKQASRKQSEDRREQRGRVRGRRKTFWKKKMMKEEEERRRRTRKTTTTTSRRRVKTRRQNRKRRRR